LQSVLPKDEFVGLLNQHRSILFKICNLYCPSGPDREDLFQEMVIQLWKSYPHFRGESKFSTWLYRIALNTAISGLRKQNRGLGTRGLESLPEQAPDIPYEQEREEQLQLLYQAISQLSSIERAFLMLYLEDKSYHEMEEILGINENNLRVKMNRIKEKLRKITKEASHGIGQP
jgi:RNA polymerase sigma-70 factor, ECF subfamily